MAWDRKEKARAGFYLPFELLQQARNCVVHLAGPPEQLTLSGLVEQALRRELKRLEKKYNDGNPFPMRNSEPRSGRPIGK